ncbi:hypothetical protein cce_1332 [Crocosphaera subtropica ATCC 51142]|uniref:Uncharacterized protein n=1 Tax=Crocosphaera subtropica (strain ATCC 51142 / BH68) TaxID=43989 RepID=B1WVU5_CROS5|nr:hypothetical protein [Crocosphaera subtropica]ACB50682.1 hypothetical protein cce_1332 [Crocosphaera subtropica ATCC 51142]
MGRKAKLKKERKSHPQTVNHCGNSSDQFVQHLERQGYSLKKPKMAPDMPEKKIDPQV